MPENIIKIKEYYLLYSTVVDAPTTWGMTLPDLTKFYKEEYGNEGIRDLQKRMSRVEDKGTSSFLDSSVEDTIAGNHAGPDGTTITLDEIYTAYCLRQPILNNWKPQET